MKFKKEYKVRNIAGENVIIMQGELGSDATRVVALNETSLFLWNRLQGEEFDIDGVVDLRWSWSCATAMPAMFMRCTLHAARDATRLRQCHVSHSTVNVRTATRTARRTP